LLLNSSPDFFVSGHCCALSIKTNDGLQYTHRVLPYQHVERSLLAQMLAQHILTAHCDWRDQLIKLEQIPVNLKIGSPKKSAVASENGQAEQSAQAAEGKSTAAAASTAGKEDEKPKEEATDGADNATKPVVYASKVWVIDL
jgi:hypothetical protein